MKRREFLSSFAIGVPALALAPTVLLSACGSGSDMAGEGGGKDATLRVIHTQSLSSLDPIWTTAPGAREFGFLTYDQLIAVDDHFVPKPQMAEGWTIGDNGRSYVIALREGLKFHDNEPVRSQDCIPSIQRWAARDGFGQILLEQVDGFDVIDDRHFRIRLKAPFPLLPAALGKSSAPACLIMPERLAKTDPTTAVTEAIGSGPFRFLKDQWVTGSKAVWERFDGYVPRKEPASGLAGGKIARVKSIVWSQITDASTALSAIQAGEQDYWDLPPADLQPAMAGNPDIVLGRRLNADTYFMLQPNHQQPPFDNPAIRQALAMALDQMAMMKSIAGNRPGDAHPSRSFYASESPYFTEAGSDVLKVADIGKARQALASAGYKGEKVVLLSGAENPAAALGQIIEDVLRRMGMTVELVTLDFSSLTQRRTNHGPVSAGGWSLFVTGWTGGDILDPVVHPMLRGAGLKGYAGWAEDPKIEALRRQWALAPEAQQKPLAEQLQIEAFKTLPYIPLGAVTANAAWRKTVTGVLPAPYGVYWNIGKTA
ncbi:ABC transporter substrate-binding protein [Flavisphingomonas formosensis]|uniref:ABC transporter substrate-binding protein n=1 Tax=Flavisphingomonas formosensis TaxID=861534 RepID=UPI0012FC0EFD|nr:ABC transporter substrate-binding protein [Sphingomonas formosensis]